MSEKNLDGPLNPNKKKIKNLKTVDPRNEEKLSSDVCQQVRLKLACPASPYCAPYIIIVQIIWATSWQNQQNDPCAQRRLRSAWASAQSDQSLRCPHEETLGPLLPTERTEKTLIRLAGYPGWPESSLGVQFILFVLSCGGSYFLVIWGSVSSFCVVWNMNRDMTNPKSCSHTGIFMFVIINHSLTIIAWGSSSRIVNLHLGLSNWQELKMFRRSNFYKLHVSVF